ncbi:MAG: putative porin [Bacteroidales bacterium]
MLRNAVILILLSLSSVLYGQKQDSVKPKILKQWNLSSDFTEEVSIDFDTVFSLFNHYRLADKYSPLNATLGNYGLPFYQINFFDRVTDPDKFLYSYYYPLMYQPERYVFMNTQVPFTELVWTYGGPREVAEQTFRVWHSQNVNRFFNFGLIYDIVYSIGQYSFQRSEDKDFTFYSSYTGERYKMHFAVGINKLLANQNGGVEDITTFQNFDTRQAAVKLGGLNKAQSILKNTNFLLVQRYTIGGTKLVPGDSSSVRKAGLSGLSGTFSHILILDKNTRTYSDQSPNSGFYDSIYINDVRTFDSLYSRSIKNTVRFDFVTDESRKFRLGGGAGIRNELFRYSQIIPTHDTTMADTAVWHRSNNVLVGRLYNDIGEKFRWVATGELYLSGYRAGDFNLNGVISKAFDLKKGRVSWDITGAITNNLPSFWYEQWGSNNFEWHNNFNKEFRIDLGTAFSYPARKTELKLNYALLDNYTDLDTAMLPNQNSGGLSVVSLFLRKELRAWKFHLATDLLVQKSSNSGILDLPMVAIRSAGYFEHLINFKKTNGQLNTQLGAEVTYNTPYHAYAYMPATGRFFRQDDVETGGYPFVNVFLNLKLKRTRIFVMFDHVNYGFSGYDYFMVPSYPQNIRMFRYGIGWTFYD